MNINKKIMAALLIMFVTLEGVLYDDSQGELSQSEINMNFARQLYDYVITNDTTGSAKHHSNTSSRIELPVEPVLQLPELPTGCEITALTTVLNYYGYDVDKEDMVNEYLPMGEIGKTNPNIAFIGTPYETNSCGCFAPVIQNVANEFLENMDAELEAVELHNKNIDDLRKYIEHDTPVIIWGTIDMAKPRIAATWVIDGEKISWFDNSHCVVLIGYDDEEGTYIVSDPLEGIVEYNQDTLERRYHSLGKQAVILRNLNFK